MSRFSRTLLSFFGITAALCLLHSCKKDKIHYKTAVKLDSHTTDRLNQAIFINESTGIAVGGDRFETSRMVVTRDGAENWTSTNKAEAGKEMFGICMSPAGILYSVGLDGKLLISHDTGTTWAFRQMDFYDPNKKIVFPTSEHGIFVSGISYVNGSVTHLNAAGDLISHETYPYELNDIKMINPKTGYISCYGVVMRTEDSGYHWEVLDIRGDNFTSVTCVGDNDVWVCGANGSIFHSGNRGQKWDKYRNGNDVTQATYYLRCITFTDLNNGWAVGEKGVVIHSMDGGKHWMEYDRFTDNDLQGISAMPNGDMIVTGNMGSLYRLLLK